MQGLSCPLEVSTSHWVIHQGIRQGLGQALSGTIWKNHPYEEWSQCCMSWSADMGTSPNLFYGVALGLLSFRVLVTKIGTGIIIVLLAPKRL